MFEPFRRLVSPCVNILKKNSDDEFVYVAAVADPSFSDPDAISVELGAGRYAVFVHEGSIKSFPQTVQAIWQHWIPNNRDVYRPAPEFEFYDDRFNGVTESGIVEVYVPVK